MKIDHLAIAVPDIEEALSFYRDALGLPLERVEQVEREGVKVAFLPLGESHIELVEPTRDDTGIVKWMARHGAGIHHICLEVDDIDISLVHLVDRGVEMINPQPIQRHDGTRYAFIHPRSAFGVLVELYEKPQLR